MNHTFPPLDPPLTPVLLYLYPQIFIVDIFFNFRTGIFVGRDGEGGDGGAEDQVEYDRWEVAKNYLK